MKRKLIVATPCYSTLHASAHTSLMGMQRFYFENVNREEYDFDDILMRGSLIPDVRHACVREAVKEDATHLLFVDSDMYVPADVPWMLMGSMLQLQAGKVEYVDEKEAMACAVVGANAVKREMPPRPCAAYGFKVPCWTERDKVLSGEQAALEKVRSVGFGVCLIDMRVFAALDQPYFKFDHISGTAFQGEDIYFCERLASLDLTVWVDHFASLEIGHVGEFRYTHDLAIECRDKEVRSDLSEDQAAA